jgi:hypothetical protein
MRRGLAVVGVCCAAIACGGATTENTPAPEAGTGGTAAGSGGTGGWVSPCDSFVGMNMSACDHSSLEAQPGPDGSLVPVTSCAVPLAVDVSQVNLNELNVAVDCNLVPYSQTEVDGADGWWHYDNVDVPTAIRIEGQLCNRIQQAGVDRIDVVFGCVPLEL